MELKICHLFPDVMNLSSDRGNLICMQKRLLWRGIDTSVLPVCVGDPFQTSGYDLVFVGNGLPFENKALLEDLKSGKSTQIKALVEDGVPVLAICGGYQLLGRTYENESGQTVDGIGALDVYTKCTAKRLVGDVVIKSGELGTTIVGFENHAGKTWLEGDVKPLGTTEPGHGNNGEDGTEGARYLNVFASYAHGSLLPKNPVLCDHILKTALERKYGAIDLPVLNDELEMKAHEYIVSRSK